MGFKERIEGGMMSVRYIWSLTFEWGLQMAILAWMFFFECDLNKLVEWVSQMILCPF